MRRLAVTPLALVLALAFASGDDLKKGLDTIKAADIQKHQAYLASDELQGREAGSEGGHQAALYITEKLAEFGFEPGGSDGGWFQPFGGGGGSYGPLEDANSLSLWKSGPSKDPDVWKLGDGFKPLKTSRAGAASGQILFAGYGISAPDLDYDDYKGLKLKGEIVLVLDGEPANENPKWNGAEPTKYAEWAHKIEAAEKAGAGGLLIVAADAVPSRDDVAWPGDPKNVTTPFPVVCLSREVGEALAKAAAKDLKKTQDEINVAGKPRSWRVTKPAKLALSYKGLPGKGSKNIIAIWRGTDEGLRDEYVVLGAHYDHVGMGNPQTSRGGAGKIHNGADDNASGTSTLLDVAQAISTVKFQRSIVCMWFDGEEAGLLGSKHWTGTPTLPIDRIVGMFNLDMVGRNDTAKILVGVEKTQGTPKYDKLMALLGEAEKRFRIKFDMTGADDLIQRSDHWSFMQRGVPAVFFTGGLHADYHTDKDDVEKINFQKEELIGRIAFFLAHTVGNQKETLK